MEVGPGEGGPQIREVNSDVSVLILPHRSYLMSDQGTVGMSYPNALIAVYIHLKSYLGTTTPK